MKRLLDTNAYVALKRGHPHVSDLVRSSTELSFSAIVLGELFFGFRNGNRFDKNAGELDALLADARVELQSGAELVTFDKHFEAVPGLAWTHVT